MRLECTQIIRRHIPDQVRALFVLVPHPVPIVDHMLGKVPLLEAAPDLVIVADAPSRRGGNEDRPVVKSVFARRTQASGELGDPNREVAWGNLDPRVPFVYSFVLGFRCRSKARREGYREGTRKGQHRARGRGRREELTPVSGHHLGGLAVVLHCEYRI